MVLVLRSIFYSHWNGSAYFRSNKKSNYAQKLVTVGLGGVVKLVDLFLKLTLLNDYWQYIYAEALTGSKRNGSSMSVPGSTTMNTLALFSTNARQTRHTANAMKHKKLHENTPNES